MTIKKGSPCSKQGFTLIEIVIVLGIFGVLMTAGTDFLIQAVRGANRSAMESEVRQNANQIMQDIIVKIRKTGSYTYTASTLTVGTNAYVVDPTGILTLNDSKLTSDAVAVCTGTCGSCTGSGLVVSGTYPNPAVVTLTVQQAPRYTRSDFCAKITLTDTITPRQY